HPHSSSLNAAWVNNIIDRLLAGKSKDIKADKRLFTELYSAYKKNEFNNALDNMRFTHKAAILNKPDKTTLENLAKLKNWWTPENEFLVLNLYLKLRVENIDQCYNFYLKNPNKFTYKSHPLCLSTLADLADRISPDKLTEAREITDSLKKLIRGKKDLSIYTRLNNNILILENKLSEAAKVAANFLENYPAAIHQKDIQTSLAEAWLDAEKFTECQKHLILANKLKTTTEDLRSRLQFVQASLFDHEGQHQKAAALYLRVGQTSKNKLTVLKSLLKSGIAFKQVKEYEKAELALKTILEKGRTDYFDNGLFELIHCYRLWQQQRKAIAAIDRLAKEGQNPRLKKQVLYIKGECYLALGEMNEAVAAYNEYINIYTNAAEHALLRYKIYRIQYSKLNKPDAAMKTLELIIDKDKTVDPQVYSDALHQKALMEKLRGQTRSSIKLWQQFLEFNSENTHALTAEVKLHLAAAYENAAAAGSYYFELANSSEAKTAKVALLKLLQLNSEADQQKIDELIITLFEKNDPAWKLALLNPLMNWKVKRLTQLKESEKNIFLESLRVYLTNNVPSCADRNYWQGFILHQLAALNSAKAPAYLAKAVELIQTHNVTSTLLKARCLSQLQRLDDALLLYLNICYQFTGKIALDNYQNWDEPLLALKSAINILISTNKTKLALKLLARFEKIHIPAIQQQTAILSLSIKGDKK
ncbi:MAG: hypothetical protein HRT88_14740, partial [Lentisphaeraceae bacterium]|nr:hypothetical protein [Lentisphaeraceae bacterium]